MFFIPAAEFDSLRRAVLAALPREACGVLLREECDGGTLLSLRMTSHHENTPVTFVIRERTLRAVGASLAGTRRTICGCVHSHVIGRAWPSYRDSEGTRAAGELWLIYSFAMRNLRLFEWNGAAFQRRSFRISKRAPPPSSRATQPDAGCGECRGCAKCVERLAALVGH